MDAGELASGNVVTMEAGGRLTEAAHLMRENHVGDVVVVEPEAGAKKPVGIITDRDLTIAIDEYGLENFGKKKVQSVMSEVLIMARRREPVEEVLQNMRDNGIRRVPVVDADDLLVGIVTLDDLLGFYGDGIMKMAELVQQEITEEIFSNS